MIGVNGASTESQLAELSKWCVPHFDRLSRGNIHGLAAAQTHFTGYGPVEADVLYCFIATNRPNRIIQIGAGVSTAVILLAASECNYTPEVICIDPYPGKYLLEVAAQNKIKLVQERAQDASLDLFTSLEPGDLLFIDSSHTVTVGSEVNLLILELLPRLRAGCFVHFHDIYFPYDYSPLILEDVFFYNESVLLHAFLTGNKRYSISVSMSMLHHAASKSVQSLIPQYEPVVLTQGIGTGQFFSHRHFPSSVYLRCDAQ